jgi:hypothetical protein
MSFGYRLMALWAITVSHLRGFDGIGAVVINIPIHEFGSLTGE